MCEREENDQSQEQPEKRPWHPPKVVELGLETAEAPTPDGFSGCESTRFPGE